MWITVLVLAIACLASIGGIFILLYFAWPAFEGFVKKLGFLCGVSLVSLFIFFFYHKDRPQ